MACETKLTKYFFGSWEELKNRLTSKAYMGFTISIKWEWTMPEEETIEWSWC